MSNNKENKQSKHTAHKVFNILCPIIAAGGLIGGGVMLYFGLTAKVPSTPTPAQITVNFAAGDGGTISYVDTKVTKDCKWKDCPRPTAVANTGFVFKGWFNDAGEIVTDNAVLTDNIKITAIFEQQGAIEDAKVTTSDSENTYEVDMNTLCSDVEETKIKLTNVATLESQEVDRATFNMPLHIGKDIIWINNNFLKNCKAFDSNITFDNNSKLTYIGESFMENCILFDKPLALPNSIRFISSAFMYNCDKYNQILTLSNNLYAISVDFMNECHSFNQPLTIPSSVKYVSSSFMYNCFDYTNTLTIENFDDSAWETDICTLATDKEGKACSTQGITISCASKQDFLDQFVNRTTLPYRTLK